LSLIESFVPTTAKKAEEWIKRMRDKHFATARPLHPDERAALQRHFDADTLDGVRIDEVTQMEKPPFLDMLRNQLAFVGVRFDFPIETTVGYTFADCVLVRESPPSLDLLFHELAHVVQYRQLGRSCFAEAYVRGFAENEFTYERIPLEVIAYQLTARYQAGEVFSVSDETARWLAARDY
jgi:hypothetical protein